MAIQDILKKHAETFVAQSPFKIVRQSHPMRYYSNLKWDANNQAYDSGENDLQVAKESIFNFGNAVLDEEFLDGLESDILGRAVCVMAGKFEAMALARQVKKVKVQNLNDFMNAFDSLSSACSPEAQIITPIQGKSSLRKMGEYRDFVPIIGSTKILTYTAFWLGPLLTQIPGNLLRSTMISTQDLSFVINDPKFELNGHRLLVSFNYHIQYSDEVFILEF